MLKGKNAIVTGSTSGIGLAIAHALAAEGCNILTNGMGDKSTIDQIVKELQTKYSVQVDYSPADMSKPKDIAEMVAMCEQKFGSCDILVNNAGIQFTAHVQDFPEDKWNSIIAINMSATFFAIKAALPGMQKRKFGRIINISSVHGLVASVDKVAYVAAKHGVIGITRTVALENGENGITSNAICPGWVHTPLVQKQIVDNAKKDGVSEDEEAKKMLGGKMVTNRFVKPEEVAGLIVFLCGDNAISMTGGAYTIDGGWTAE